MNHALHTEKAPTAVGPYSQAVRSENLIFVSGQLPIDPQTGKFAGEDIISQTTRSLENIKVILESQGLTMGSIVKTTVYLKDMEEFGTMNEVYAKYFSGVFPARAAIQVAALPMDARVEIEAIAAS